MYHPTRWLSELVNAVYAAIEVERAFLTKYRSGVDARIREAGWRMNGPEMAFLADCGGRLYFLGIDAEGRPVARTFHDVPEHDRKMSVDRLRDMYWPRAKAGSENLQVEMNPGFSILEGGFGMTLHSLGIGSKASTLGPVGYASRPHASLLEEILSRLDPDTLAIIDNNAYVTQQDYAWLAADPRRRDLCRRHPGTLGTISRDKSRIEAELERGTPSSEIILGSYAATGSIPPSMVSNPAVRNRLVTALSLSEGLDIGVIAGLPELIACGLPLERIPQTAEDWVGFAHLHSAARALSADDPAAVSRFLDIPGGNYAETWGRLIRNPLVSGLLSNHSPGRPREIETFSLMMYHGHVGMMLYDYLIGPLAGILGIKHDRGQAVRRATKLVVGDKSLVRALEAVHGFHSNNARAFEALAELCAARRISWYPPQVVHEMQVHKHKVRWLLTPKELIDEGAVGPDSKGMNGLDHCVSAYIAKCITGQAYILSIRKRDESRVWRRISTAEFAWDRSRSRMVLVQHRGMSNSEPSEEAQRVVRRVLEILHDPREPLNIRWGNNAKLPAGVEVAGFAASISGVVRTRAETEKMLRVFEPWFPKSCRGISLEQFAAAVLSDQPQEPTLVEPDAISSLRAHLEGN